MARPSIFVVALIVAVAAVAAEPEPGYIKPVARVLHFHSEPVVHYIHSRHYHEPHHHVHHLHDHHHHEDVLHDHHHLHHHDLHHHDVHHHDLHHHDLHHLHHDWH